MAGETIREVVVKARLEFERATIAPLEDVKRKAVEASAAVTRIGESADKAGAAMRGMPDMLRMPRSASGAENVKPPIAQARGGDGASLHEAGRSIKTGSFNFKEGVEKFRAVVGGLAASLVAIGHSREINERILAEGNRTIRGITGEDSVSDLLPKQMELLARIPDAINAIDADLSMLNARIYSFFGADGMAQSEERKALGKYEAIRQKQFTPEAVAKRREENDRATLVVLQEQAQKTEQLKAIYDRQHEARVAQLRKEQSVIEQAVDKLRDRIDSGREAFGLLNFDERESLKAIVDKVAAGGLGTLRPDELDRFRSNPALSGLLTEEAVKNATANGYEEVLRKLGLDRRLADEEAKLQAKIELIENITINSDPAKAVKQITDELTALQERLIRESLEKLKAEFGKQVAKTRANLN